MTVSSGRNCAGFFGLEGPLGSLARMFLEYGSWRSTEYVMTWKLEASPSSRSIFRLAPSMPRTSAKGPGSSAAPSAWPTPVATDCNRNRAETSEAKKARGAKDGMTLVDAAAVAGWPTPLANRGGPDLRRAERTDGAATLPTVAVWATPVARDHRSVIGPADAGDRNARPLSEQAGAVLGMTPSGCSAPTESCGGLAPDGVAWLMGYPPEWLACAPPDTRDPRYRAAAAKRRRKEVRRTVRGWLHPDPPG